MRARLPHLSDRRRRLIRSPGRRHQGWALGRTLVCLVAAHMLGGGLAAAQGRGATGGAQRDARYDLVHGALASATASIANQVLPRIDLAQSSGWARVRRQATVIVANGETGRFSSGGEVNVRLLGALTTGIQAI